ncbi:MAG: ABC transporter ATP-binding protein [Desertimonas sp.]
MAGIGSAHLRPGSNPLLRVEDLVVEFPVTRHDKVHAVSDLAFDVCEGETLGLVGESGCGKSTVAKALIQMPPPTSGTIQFDGVDLARLDGSEQRRMRRQLQMIFQDPISSLNPRRRCRDIVGHGIGADVPRAERDTLVDGLLRTVGLDPDLVRDRRPHEFSGGQCQRLSIARALAIDPKMIVCDEPVSALDVSIQAQILNLLAELKEQRALTMVFISHDLSVVRRICDRVMVMYLGRLCEIGPADSLYASPAHPYTKLLLGSVARVEARRARLSTGAPTEMPSPIDPPSGCRFRTRCPLADDRCAAEVPVAREVQPGHFVACHHPLVDPTTHEPTTTPVEVVAPEVAG